MPTKSLFEEEAPNIVTQKCSTKCGVREPLHVEFALKNRELVKAEVFEKRVFEHEEMKGAFSLNNLLVGTLRPPDRHKLVGPVALWTTMGCPSDKVGGRKSLCVRALSAFLSLSVKVCRDSSSCFPLLAPQSLRHTEPWAQYLGPRSSSGKPSQRNWGSPNFH